MDWIKDIITTKPIVINNEKKSKTGKDVITPSLPSSGTEMNLAIIKFLIEIKNNKKNIKFLCSAKTIFLKASYGLSINF